MGERSMGGQTMGETVLCGARRLVRLGEGIERLEKSQAQVVEVSLISQDGDPLRAEPTIPISRVKLLELLKEEQEYVGQRLARILGTLYGPGK